MKTIIIALSVVALVGCKSGSNGNNSNSTNYLSVNTINAEKLALTTSSNFKTLSTGIILNPLNSCSLYFSLFL